MRRNLRHLPVTAPRLSGRAVRQRPQASSDSRPHGGGNRSGVSGPASESTPTVLGPASRTHELHAIAVNGSLRAGASLVNTVSTNVAGRGITGCHDGSSRRRKSPANPNPRDCPTRGITGGREPAVLGVGGGAPALRPVAQAKIDCGAAKRTSVEASSPCAATALIRARRMRSGSRRCPAFSGELRRRRGSARRSRSCESTPAASPADQIPRAAC
jgi:hypothetical protein